MRAARTAAVVTWIYAAGFGIPAVPVAIYVLQRGYLPWFAGLFPMYGGPWSDRSLDLFVVLLIVFFALMLVVSYAAWLVWRGSRTGAVLALVLLPVEAVFWIGFALPFPWPIGIARAALFISAARSAGTAARRPGLRHRFGWRGIRPAGPGGSRSR
jgi:hypothetical protein